MSNLDSSKDLNGKTPECWKKHTQKKTNKRQGKHVNATQEKQKKGGNPQNLRQSWLDAPL